MTPLSAFRPRIAPRVLTALDPTIDQAVLDTCIDFCEQTLIVKATLDSFSTVAATREYDLDATSVMENVCRVMRVWCSETELGATAEDDVNSPFAYVDAITGSTNSRSMPRCYTETSPGVLGLMPTPDAAYQMTIRAAMKPKRSATTVQDILYENWVEAIVDGALFRLYSMPGMAFSNTGMAGVHGALYKKGVNAALLEASRGRTRAERMVRPMYI